MKNIIFLYIVILLSISCGTKKPDDASNAPIENPDINQVVGIGKIEPENEILQLTAEVSGIVVKVYKHENDSVKAGETILELKHSIEDANIADLQNKVATQAAQVKADQANTRTIKIKYDNAVLTLKRLQGLLEKGAETQQAVDNAQTEMKTLQAEIAQQKSLVEVSKRKLAETKTQVKISIETLKQKFIKAPVNGVLIEMSNANVGSPIDPTQAFAQLNSESQPVVVCEIDELFADKMVEGQQAWIRNAGSMDTISMGRVYFVSSFLKKKSLFTDQAGEKQDRRVREIKIKLDNPKPILLNTRVECVVNVSKSQ